MLRPDLIREQYWIESPDAVAIRVTVTRWSPGRTSRRKVSGSQSRPLRALRERRFAVTDVTDPVEGADRVNPLPYRRGRSHRVRRVPSDRR